MTIILVNYNTSHLLARLFAAIEASRANLSLQIIVVDNASSDGSVEFLQTKYPGLELNQKQNERRLREGQ